jgi:hypothetical protein
LWPLVRGCTADVVGQAMLDSAGVGGWRGSAAFGAWATVANAGRMP